MIDKKLVMKQLKKVMDPELQISIVDLGLIYGVRVKEGINRNKRVQIRMTLTTPGCPLASVIERMIIETVMETGGIKREDIEVELVWDPPWTSDLMTEEAKLELGMR